MTLSYNPEEYKNFKADTGIDWETDHLGNRTGKGREWHTFSWDVEESVK